MGSNKFNVLMIIKPMLTCQHWFYFSLALFFSSASAIEKNTVKEVFKKYDYILGVIYDKRKNVYSTLSAISGKEVEFYQFDSKPVLLKKFSEDTVSVSLLTYPEFFSKFKHIRNKSKYFEKLPVALNQYIQLLKIEPFDMSIEYRLITSPKSIFKESEKKAAKGKIKLIFYDNINNEQISNFSKFVEKYMISTLAHEVFHFLSGYSSLERMNELREEVYADLFGNCLTYEIYPEVITGLTIEKFPQHYFRDTKKDLKEIRKSYKKAGYMKSTVATVIAHYYFRAVSQKHFEEKIQSKNIPKFCKRLFMEKNFKHPIEKKPPTWLHEYLSSQ